MAKNLGTSDLPKFAGTPASPYDGQVWYDTVAAKARVYEAGAVQDLVSAGGGGSTPGSANPLMDGTVAVGSSSAYAREDHRHPTDTSLIPKSMMIGMVMDWPLPARSIPSGWVACYGQSLDIATYPALYDLMCPLITSTATAAAATDVITTPTAHGLVVGDRIAFISATTGAGLTLGTSSFVASVPSSTTFTVGSGMTVNAITGAVTVSGAPVNITTDYTGLVVRQYPYGPPTTTQFRMPDLRGRVTVGMDNMGGTDGGFLPSTFPNIIGLGGTNSGIIGEGLHTILTAEAAQKAVTANASAVTGITGSNGASSVGGVDHLHSTSAFINSTGATVATTNTGSTTRYNNNAVISGTGAADRSLATTAAAQAWSQTGSGTAAGQGITGSDATTGHNNIQPSVMVHKIMYTGV